MKKILPYLFKVFVFLFPIIYLLGAFFAFSMNQGMFKTDSVLGVLAPYTFLFSSIFMFLFLTKFFSSKKTKYIFIYFIILLIPLLLGFLPERFVNPYIEGLTPEVCETGKPFVPWGFKYNKNESSATARDVCYMRLEMCNMIIGHDNSTLDICETIYLNNKFGNCPGEIPHNEENCDMFRLEDVKNRCLKRIDDSFYNRCF